MYDSFHRCFEALHEQSFEMIGIKNSNERDLWEERATRDIQRSFARPENISKKRQHQGSVRYFLLLWREIVVSKLYKNYFYDDI